MSGEAFEGHSDTGRQGAKRHTTAVCGASQPRLSVEAGFGTPAVAYFPVDTKL